MTNLRERLMDAIGVLDTDAALTVFADWLRDQARDADARSGWPTRYPQTAGEVGATAIGIVCTALADEVADLVDA